MSPMTSGREDFAMGGLGRAWQRRYRVVVGTLGSVCRLLDDRREGQRAHEWPGAPRAPDFLLCDRRLRAGLSKE